jgi:hypothetical protein
MEVIDRSAFGDLFLLDNEGRVYLLDVGAGVLSQVAESQLEFESLSADPGRHEEWFAVNETRAAAERGLVPGEHQCIGFSIPTVFAQAGGSDAAYVADIYDHLGFLGDMHRQISKMPDGAKVKLIIKKPEGNP